jgi:hypothetical protein
VGVYLGGSVASKLDVGAFNEILLVVVSVILVMLVVMFLTSFESRYWKGLFIMDEGYVSILKVQNNNM